MLLLLLLKTAVNKVKLNLPPKSKTLREYIVARFAGMWPTIPALCESTSSSRFGNALARASGIGPWRPQLDRVSPSMHCEGEGEGVGQSDANDGLRVEVGRGGGGRSLPSALMSTASRAHECRKQNMQLTWDEHSTQ